MTPHKTKKSSILSPQELQAIQELQETYDLPSEVAQRDLAEIIEAKIRVTEAWNALQVARDEVASLMTQLETELALGMRIEPGEFVVSTDPTGRAEVIRAQDEAPEIKGLIPDEEIPF
jgi:hypothetical protein